jgi:hypothetical protein
MGLEPITYRLQGGCSAGLSYVGGKQVFKRLALYQRQPPAAR